nr:transposase [Lentzea aerocolonigenes]
MDRAAGCGPARTGDDAASVTARQLRDVVVRLIASGHWSPGDPEILLVADAGYDGPRLAHVLADLPVLVLVRVPKPSRPGPGRPTGLPNHQPATRHDVHTATSTNKQQPKRGKKIKSSNPRPRRTG